MLKKQIAFEEPHLRIQSPVPDADTRAAFFLLNLPRILGLAPILLLLVFAFGCATTTTNTVPKQIYYSVSQISIDHGDPDRAIEELMAVPSGERDSKYYIIIGKAYLMKGNYPKAIESYKKAIEKDSTNEEAKSSLAKIYIKMGKYDLAIKYLEDLIKSKNPQIKTDAKLDLGWVYLKQGKHSEAEKMFLGVLESDPGNWLANFKLGFVYYEKKDYEKAVEYYLKALSGVPSLSKSQVYYNLGLAYYKEGDIPKAKDAWMGAVKVDPYGEFGQKAQGKLGLLL